jgi:glycosyltransferase involved in cell wall biosynthesis
MSLRVSVITPSCNKSIFLPWCIESVGRQTLTDWEHIIIDDGSTDDSYVVAQRFAEREPRLKVFCQPNGGVARARNSGYRQIAPDSRYLLFLDADDVLEPEMLEVMVNYLDNHPNSGLAYTELQHIDENNREVDRLPLAARRWEVNERGRVVPIPPEQPVNRFHSLFAWSGLIPSCCLIRRSVYDEIGGFCEDFGQLFEDTHLFLSVALRSEVHYLPQIMVRYRVYKDQASSNERKLWNQEKKLYKKWLYGAELTAGQRQEVWKAWYFRQHLLMPYLSRRWAKESLQSGNLRDASFHLFRAVRHEYIYMKTVLASCFTLDDPWLQLIRDARKSRLEGHR